MGCLKCNKVVTNTNTTDMKVSAEVQETLMGTIGGYVLGNETEEYPEMFIVEIYNREGDHKGHRYFFFPQLDLHIDLGIVR